MRSYQEVITPDAITSKGLLTVHKIEDKYFFEIPVSLLQRDLLISNRLSEAAADMRTGRAMEGYAGDPIGSSVIRMERAPGNKIFIRRISFSEYSRDSTRPMYAAVQANTIQPIVAVFPIAAYRQDSSALVLDITEFINGDNELTGFDAMSKATMHVGQQQNDRSYLEYVHVYPENLEIRSIKTYSIAGGAHAGNYTVEINSSMVLLPAVPMKARYADPRVGFFTTDYIDYDANDQGVKGQKIANRWRLEPKPEDMEKYERGELVEPRRPILFYIDRTTPAKWVPYLIQGVNDWAWAFEQAGFKNAISARLAPSPEEDPDFDLEDARHSAIVYKPSQVANATGPSIADPRSGEIIESHVNWYHNVMSIVHNWYMIQCGAVDPRARKMRFDDSLMGQLIRFISSHEIGHTLGLRHNFGSSSTVPVDSLRSGRWVEAHGHTPSIMDYARFNYVAQPEDHITEAGLFPRIGDYDRWAIEWGYQWFGEDRSAEAETSILQKLTTERQKDKRCWFGSETQITDPRSQNEDLGDDAVKAGGYGIKNLKRILPQLIEWTQEPGEGYEDLNIVYQALLGQFDLYMGHALKSVGGLMETPKMTEQPGPVYVAVAPSRQKEAVAFLDRNLFITPVWLYNKEIFDKTGDLFTDLILERQRNLLNKLMDRGRLSRMIDGTAAAALSGQTGPSLPAAANTAPTYTIQDLFSDLDHAIFRELYAGRPVDLYRRNLQKAYVEQLLQLAYPVNTPPALSQPLPSQLSAAGQPPVMPNGLGGAGEQLPIALCDISSAIRATLRQELQLLHHTSLTATDRETRQHLADLEERITRAVHNDK
jgi:Met-zincin/Domain of unknown function (DUF5117)/Domain of unknown function (DUF5118)